MHRVPRRGRKFYEALREDLEWYAGRYFRLKRFDDKGKNREGELKEKLSEEISDEEAEEIAEELFLPDLSPPLKRVWRSYIRMRDQTPLGYSGYEPVEWRTIESFMNTSGVHLSVWEVELIEMIDHIYRRPAEEEEETKSLNHAAKLIGSSEVVSAKNAVGIKALFGGVKKRREKMKKDR